jgi:predicted acylesterase/phospholipase RssA
MLAALIDAGIVPDLLVGTSVGALNAAMFAASPDAAGVADLAATATALLASCAIPGVFPPVTVDGRRLANGGTTANEPVPQALALGAATVFQLSTFGPRDGPVAPRRARVAEALDRRFGRPPASPRLDARGDPAARRAVHVCSRRRRRPT